MTQTAQFPFVPRFMSTPPGLTSLQLLDCRAADTCVVAIGTTARVLAGAYTPGRGDHILEPRALQTVPVPQLSALSK